jgi:hypothetical protein
VCAILFASHSVPSSRAIAVGIVLFAAIAFVELFRAARVADDPNARAALEFEHALFPQRAAQRRPVQLERVDRDIVLGAVTDVWARHGLFPRLRTVAAARLSARRGIDLARNPQAARDVLGEDMWELLHPDRPEAADRYAQSVTLEEVDAMLDRLESL